jgi:hypothetical protein
MILTFLEMFSVWGGIWFEDLPSVIRVSTNTFCNYTHHVSQLYC